ncbi:MAG: hypothetical protein HDR02_07350 [Lachnospiraceae bacterium]|nr:hypothetical protein [Lachnospiraceae bacterium]
MKKRVKRALKYAFEAPAPLSKELFLRSLPQPRCGGRTFVLSQVGYIPLWVWGVSFVTFLIALFSAHYVRKNILGILSACIPFVASSVVAENGKSMVYRMAELEKASLFSLRSVALARLGIIGFSHLILLCLLSPLAAVGSLTSTLQAGVYLLLPYLLTTWLSLVFTRKSRSRDTSYLCMGTAVMISGLCVMTQSKFYLIYRPEYFHCWVVLTAVLLTLTALGYYGTIKRTEELSWNLF